MGCRKRGFRKTVYDGEVLSLATDKIAKKLFVKPFKIFLKIYIDCSNASFDITFLLMTTSLLGPLSYSSPGTQICTRTGNEVEKIEITSWAGGATSWWCIRNRTCERSERARFLIQTTSVKIPYKPATHEVIYLFHTYWVNISSFYLGKLLFI